MTSTSACEKRNNAYVIRRVTVLHFADSLRARIGSKKALDEFYRYRKKQPQQANIQAIITHSAERLTKRGYMRAAGVRNKMNHSDHNADAARQKTNRKILGRSDATESFMSINLKFAQFEGPFDLLVRLIEKEELSINDVSLSYVTERYLHYVDNATEIPSGELADFLVVATRLLLIKAKSLLPFLEIDEEDETDLAGQLKMYKLFADAAIDIEKMLLADKRLFARKPPQMKNITPVFSPPKGLGVRDLRDMLRNILKNVQPVIALPERRMERAVSMKEKIHHIRSLVGGNTQKASFRELLRSAESRTEVVVTFLALLELIKRKDVVAEQDKLFRDISITKV